MRKNAFSLALTLWIVAIMSLASALYLSYAKTTIQKISQLNTKLKLTFDTESTLELLKFYISTGYIQKDKIINDSLRFLSISNSIRIDGMKEIFDNRTVILQDTAGLLNINDIGAISNYFTLYSTIEKKNIIRDSMKDWLDLDNYTSLNGAEKLFYKNKKYKYSPRNELYFASKEEIFLIRGLIQYYSIQYKLYKNLTISNSSFRNILTMNSDLLGRIYGLTKNELKQLEKVKKNDTNSFVNMFYSFANDIDWERDSTFPSNIIQIKVNSSVDNIKKNIELVIDFRATDEYAFSILEYDD